MKSNKSEEPLYFSWFDFNKNEVIEAFNKKPHVKKRRRLIEQLSNRIDGLQQLNAKQRTVFMNSCIKNKSIK